MYALGSLPQTGSHFPTQHSCLLHLAEYQPYDISAQLESQVCFFICFCKLHEKYTVSPVLAERYTAFTMATLLMASAGMTSGSRSSRTAAIISATTWA